MSSILDSFLGLTFTLLIDIVLLLFVGLQKFLRVLMATGDLTAIFLNTIILGGAVVTGLFVAFAGSSSK